MNRLYERQYSDIIQVGKLADKLSQYDEHKSLGPLKEKILTGLRSIKTTVNVPARRSILNNLHKEVRGHFNSSDEIVTEVPMTVEEAMRFDISSEGKINNAIRQLSDEQKRVAVALETNEKLQEELTKKTKQYNEANGRLTAMQETIAQLTAENEEKAQQLSDARAQCTALLAEKDRIAAELVELRATVEATNARHAADVAAARAEKEYIQQRYDEQTAELVARITELAALRAEHDAQTAVVAHITAELLAAQTARDETQAALTAARAETDTLRGERDVLSRQVADLREELKNALAEHGITTEEGTAAINKHNAEIDGINVQMDVLREEFNKQNKIVTELTGQTQQQEAEIANLLQQLDTQTGTNNKLQEEMEKLTAAYKDLLSRLDARNFENYELTYKLKNLELENKKYAKEVADLKEAIATRPGEIIQLERELIDKNAIVERNNTTIRSLQEELANAQADSINTTQLQSDYDKQGSKVLTLEREITTLTEKLLQLENDNKIKSEAVIRGQAKINKLNIQIKGNEQNRNTELFNQVQALKGELEAQTKEFNRVKSEISIRNEQIEILQSHNAELAKIRDKANAEVTRFNAEKGALQKEYEAKIDELNKTINRLNREYSESKKKIPALLKNVEDIRKEIDGLAQQLVAAKSDRDKLKDQVTQLQQENVKLNEKNNTLAKQVADMTAKHATDIAQLQGAPVATDAQKNEIVRLTTDNVALKQDAVGLRDTIAKLNQQLEAKDKELETALSTSRSFEKLTKEKDTDLRTINDLNSNVKILQKQNGELNDTIGELEEKLENQDKERQLMWANRVGQTALEIGNMKDENYKLKTKLGQTSSSSDTSIPELNKVLNFIKKADYKQAYFIYDGDIKLLFTEYNNIIKKIILVLDRNKTITIPENIKEQLQELLNLTPNNIKNNMQEMYAKHINNIDYAFDNSIRPILLNSAYNSMNPIPKLEIFMLITNINDKIIKEVERLHKEDINNFINLYRPVIKWFTELEIRSPFTINQLNSDITDLNKKVEGYYNQHKTVINNLFEIVKNRYDPYANNYFNGTTQ